MKEYFPQVKKVEFTQDKFKPGLYFRQYNADELVGGKKMREHLKFSHGILAYDDCRGRRSVRSGYSNPPVAGIKPDGKGKGARLCGI